MVSQIRPGTYIVSTPDFCPFTLKVGCDAPFTVRHFLLECGDFVQVRNKCFCVDYMKQLFQDIHMILIVL